ncbi:MAG: monofunctional biosynthetic peptidoglycan transglycosylase [Bacteroidales bacterium]
MFPAPTDSLKRMTGKILSFLRWIIIVFLLWSVGGVIIYRFWNPPLTFLMLQRLKEQAVAGQKLKLDRKWVPLEKISPNLIQAVVASEDNNFLNHYGFDMEAISDALHHNEKSKRVHGASTITQQTAKNVFLWPKRSYTRKAFEFYFTLLIETFWSKERIMEVYLNSIEMGKGIYGAEAAARTYFRKPASRLSRAEAALIATSLPAPRKRNPAAPSAYMLRHQARILKLMGMIGPVDFR